MPAALSDQDLGSSTDPEALRIGYPRTLARLVKGKNINENTLLATDYLNHFNEIIMMLDMVASMPELLEDAREWAPKSYVEHFRDSCFTDKDLAILAYENAPEKFRVPFDNTISHMNAVVESGLKQIEQAVESQDDLRLQSTVANVTGVLGKFVEVASAIIHGDERTMDQSEIDAIITE